MKSLIVIPIETTRDAPISETKPLNQLKKWAFYVLLRLTKSSKLPIIQYFSSPSSISLSETVYNYLQLLPTHIIPIKTLLSALKYLEFSLKQQKIIITSLEFLIKILFPVLFFTKSDETLWNQDSKEYIRTTEDPDHPLNELRARIAQIAALILNNDKVLLLEFEKQIREIFETPNMWLYQEVILGLLFEFRSFLKEETLILCVLTALQSPLAPLRAKGAMIIKELGVLDFETVGFIEKLAEMVIKGVIDVDFVVRYQAILGLGGIMEDDRVKIRLNGNVLNIMEALLKVMDQIESEEVVSVLEKLIEVFPEEIKGAAVQLLGILEKAFLQFSKKGHEEGEYAGLRVLETMKTLVLKAECEVSGIEKILGVAIRPENRQFLRPAVELLALLLQKTKNESFFGYFPLLIYRVIGVPNVDLTGVSGELREILGAIGTSPSGFEDLEAVMTGFGVIINRLKEDIMNRTDWFGNRFVGLIVALVEESRKRMEGEFEQSLGIHLFVFIMENCQNLDWKFYEDLMMLIAGFNGTDTLYWKTVEIVT